MNIVRDVLNRLYRWLDGFTGRDRLALLGVTIIVLIMSWYSFVHGPQQTRQKILHSRAVAAGADIKKLQAETMMVDRRHKDDPDMEDRRQLAALKADLEKLEDRLHLMTEDLIAPQQMSQVLETLLLQQRGLTLLRLENQQPVEVAGLPLLAEGATAVDHPRLFRHTLLMVFSGGYLDTMHYLQSLERLERRIFWDTLEIHSENYPKTRVLLKVHTLSLKEEWIGV